MYFPPTALRLTSPNQRVSNIFNQNTMQPIILSSSRHIRCGSQTSKLSLSALRSHRTNSPSQLCLVCRQRQRPSRIAQVPKQISRSFASQPSASTARDNLTSSAAPVSAPPTHYSLFPRTFPNGPPPSGTFGVPIRELRTEYISLQRLSHPDLSPLPKLQAEAQSAIISHAYKTLCSPLLRAEYLLSLRGIEIAEDGKVDDDGLLMEVLEAREEIEDARTEEEIMELRDRNGERVDEVVKSLEVIFEGGEGWEKARKEVVRLRYWVGVAESLDAWEGGKVGAIIH